MAQEVEPAKHLVAPLKNQTAGWAALHGLSLGRLALPLPWLSRGLITVPEEPP